MGRSKYDLAPVGSVYGKWKVQWVHKRINTMKNDMTEIEFINWCVKVAEIHGGSCGV